MKQPAKQKRMGDQSPPGFLTDLLSGSQFRLRMIKLTLDQIRRYERNPRRFGNEHYEEIRESIRHRGLDQPLVVTQRPGESFYVLKKGGGTRWQALNELWEETSEKRFFELECVFEPYVDELDLFVGHGIENLKRSPMMFIETAFYYLDLMQLHEDLEGRELSLREACILINADGYSIDHARLVRYRYCVELYQHIPIMLENGMGRTTIDQIRKLERTYRTLWERHSKDDTVFDALWAATLASCDNPDVFDDHRFQTSIEQSMARELVINLRHLTAEADSILAAPDPNDVQPNLFPQVVAGQHENSSVAPTNTAGDDDPAPEHVAREAVSPRKTVQRQSVEPRAFRTPNVEASRSNEEHVAADKLELEAALQTCSTTNNLSISLDLEDNVPVPDAIQSQFDLFIGARHAHDDIPLFRAVKVAVGWGRGILLSFPGVKLLNPDGSTNPIGALEDDNTPYRLDLYTLDRPLGGRMLIDFVWWRMWKAIEGPYTTETPDSFSRTIRALETAFESPLVQIRMDLQSPILFADPACQWIDIPLRNFEQALRDFHLLRRSLQGTAIQSTMGNAA